MAGAGGASLWSARSGGAMSPTTMLCDRGDDSMGGFRFADHLLWDDLCLFLRRVITAWSGVVPLSLPVKTFVSVISLRPGGRCAQLNLKDEFSNKFFERQPDLHLGTRASCCLLPGRFKTAPICLRSGGYSGVLFGLGILCRSVELIPSKPRRKMLNLSKLRS